MILGLSDGVDSAAAAYLLKKQGYDVNAVYLDIAGEKEKQSAAESARLLDIPFTAVDVRAALREKVFEPLARGYLNGRTVNPCVLCNPLVKLAALEEEAGRTGARLIATGHYVYSDGERLFRGHPDHDQSYMLCRISREQIKHLLLPLGRMNKAEVRRIASKLSLPAADRPDSRDLCLIPRGVSYAQWMEKEFACPGPGSVFFRGERIGRHEGIHRYTVGMRLPFEKDGRYLYVSRIDPETNALHAALWEELFTGRVILSGLHFFADPPASPFRGEIRVHHTRHETPACTVTLNKNGAAVQTDSPVRAPCPGQAAALYVGDELIGSGIVEGGIDDPPDMKLTGSPPFRCGNSVPCPPFHGWHPA